MYNQAPAPSMREPLGHRSFLDGFLSSSIEHCLFSPDGGAYCLVAYEKKLYIWDTVTGMLVRTFSAGAETLGCAYSPDGKTILSIHADNSLKLWDVESSTCRSSVIPYTGDLKMLGNPARLAGPCAFSFDKTILVVCGDGSFNEINLETGDRYFRCLINLPPHIKQKSTSPTIYCEGLFSGRILSVSHDYTLRVWRKGQRTLEQTIDFFGDRFLCISSRCNKVLLSHAGKVKILDFSKAATPTEESWDYNVDNLDHFKLSVDGLNLFARNLVEHAFYIFNLADKTIALKWSIPDSEAISCIAYSGKKTKILIGYKNGTVKIWDLPEPTAALPRERDTKHVPFMVQQFGKPQ